MNNLSAQANAAFTPQIKICGITQIDEALSCAELGADAIGFIFHPKSPRYITFEKAKEIISALPRHIVAVGVFVNEPVNKIIEVAKFCGLGAIQLHGNETPNDIEKLLYLNIPVIKALYMKGEPCVENAFLYNATSFLVECEKGMLPGGNAIQWKWEDAADFGKHFPFILAGGLTPDNISTAINAANPDAVDVSTGVEISPGRKDLQKVKNFIENVKTCKIYRKPRRIFYEFSK